MPSRPELTFEPPGPGTWMLDTQHYPTPMSLFKQGFEPQTRSLALGLGFAEYGVPMLSVAATVHGFCYNHAAPVGVAIGSGDSQDAANPVISKRFAEGKRTYNEKSWLKALEQWDHEVKPDSIRRNSALASVDLDALDHDGIVRHLSHCRENSTEMIRRHHLFSVPSIIAAGLLYVDAVEWTGLDVTELIGLMDGASPISSGTTPDLIRLTAAMREDTAAMKVLESGDSASAKIDRLRSDDGPVGDAMNQYLLVDGHRLATGYDIFNQSLMELPETIESRIRESVENGVDGQEPVPDELVSRVRQMVPEQHRKSFDELLSEARQMARLKDERGIYNDIWADGIARQAIIAGGQRLAADGLLSDPHLLLEASWPEMQLLLRGLEPVSNEELVARRDTRRSLSWREIPAVLGPPSERPAPMAGLPPEVARLTRALGMVSGLFMVTARVGSSTDLAGAAASAGVHEGRARIAVGDYDFANIKHGDVLVTSTHSAAFNLVAGRVGAIVTDTGGILSHLAIVSREYGIPCVVACNNATTVIPEDALIRIDGKAGTVTVISE